MARPTTRPRARRAPPPAAAALLLGLLGLAARGGAAAAAAGPAAGATAAAAAAAAPPLVLSAARGARAPLAARSRGGLRLRLPLGRPRVRSAAEARAALVATATAAAGAQAEPEEDDGGGATLPASAVNLVKAIVGSGVLSLPAAVAAFSASRAAIGPSLALLSFLAALSGYCFAAVGRTCAATGSSTWDGAWEKTMGAGTRALPAGLIVAKCFVACLAYTMVIGDAFSALFGAAPWAPALLGSRTGCIGVFVVCALLPLSLLPSLECLKVTSMFGVAGLLYTAAFMTRRLLGGEYGAGGALLADVPAALRPRFEPAPPAGALGTLGTPKVFVLVSVLATAFTAHYSAPRMYAELKPPAPRAPKVRKWSALVSLGFGASAGLMALMMAVGYGTFGGACSGLILNNYAPTDTLAALSRVAVGASIVCTYPIAFTGLRDGAFGLLAPARAAEPRARLLATLALMAVVTACGIVLTDLGVVAAVSGALLASLIVYVLPATMWANVLAKRVAGGGGGRAELALCRLVQGLGLVFGAIGVTVTLSK